MVTTAGLTPNEAALGYDTLKGAEDVIIDTVHAPPQFPFDVAIDRREELARWLLNRRDALVADAHQQLSGD